MSWIDKEYWYIVWVLAVGIIGGTLGLLDESGRPRKNRTKKAFFVAAATSAFLCWATYEIVFFLSHVTPFSLAIGGIIAWMGAEWVRRKIDRAANKKIDGLGKDYGSHDGYARSEYEENLK